METLRDGVFDTSRQLAYECDMPYAMVRHYLRQLNLGGLLEGLVLTYAGHKALAGEELKNSDMHEYVDLRISDVRPHHL